MSEGLPNAVPGTESVAAAAASPCRRSPGIKGSRSNPLPPALFLASSPATAATIESPAPRLFSIGCVGNPNASRFSADEQGTVIYR